MDIVARALALNSKIDMVRSIDSFIYVQRVFGTKFYVWYRQPNNRWIRYDIRKYNTASLNLDAWRIHAIDVLDILGTTPLEDTTELNLINVTSGGANFEYAIRIKDAPDYFGGQHGNEKMTNVLFLQDGKPVPYDSFAGGKACNKFEMVQNSIMYDPTDKTTVSGEMSTRWIFTNEGLTLKWEFEWENAFTVDSAFGAMLPANRGANQITKFRFIEESVENDVSEELNNAPRKDSLGVDMYNSTNNLTIGVELEDEFFNGFAKTSGEGMWVYNGVYNKAYPTRVNPKETELVTNGDIWKCTARFKVFMPK